MAEEIQEEENDELVQDKTKRNEVETSPMRIPLLSFLNDLCEQYDSRFVVLLAFQYFNQGSKAMLYLAEKDLYKEYMGMDPSTMAYLSSITSLPWSVKILYGLFSDNVPIMGTRRKSHVVIMGLLQFVSLVSVFLFDLESKSAVASMLFCASLSGAYLDVIVDALMVTQSRIDTEDGSEQLQSLSWGALGAGGIFGSLFGGYLTEYFHPKWTFLLYSSYGMIVMILGTRLDSKLEQDELDSFQKKSFIEELKLNLTQIKDALKSREAFNVILFLFLNGLCSPSFGTYSYYFQLNIVKFSKFQYAMFGVLGYFCLSMGTVFYNLYCKEKECRTLMKWACYLGVIGAVFSYCFAMRWNVAVGINDVVFLALSDLVLGTFGLAFSNLPMMVLFAKITPNHIEATFFAFVTGTSNFCNGVISPFIGSQLNDLLVGVTDKDLSKYPILMIISMFTSVLPFLFLHLIPLREELKVTGANEAPKAETEMTTKTSKDTDETKEEEESLNK